MSHTTQKPKSLQLAVELDYRREYEAAHELRTMQALIAKLEAQLHTISTGGVGESFQPPVQPDTAAQQEPVAWMYEWNGRMHITTADQRPIEHAHPHFNKSNPLYTAPQPTENLRCESTQKRLATLWGYVKQDLARKQLTEARVHDLLVTVCSDGSVPSLQEVKEQAPHIFELARAIEEAHGITGGQQ